MKILDKNDELEKSKDQIWSDLQETVNESIKASEKAGRRLKEWVSLILKSVKPFG